MNATPSGRVIVLGAVNVDRILRCPSLPVPGETVLVVSAVDDFGGKGANQAVAAAALGAPTELVARVGADPDGLRALVKLRAADVGVESVIVDNSAPTGQAVVLVDADGENSVAVISGANDLLSPTDVADALTVLQPLRGDVLLTNGEVPRSCLKAVARSLPTGVRWIHNAAPARSLPAWPSDRGPLLVANDVEAQQLTGATNPPTAASLLAARGAGAVVTMGARGAVVAAEGCTMTLSAPAVAVVDTTGAGDVFCGALAAELALGEDVMAAAMTAVHAGSYAVTGLGARGAMPRRHDVTRLATAHQLPQCPRRDMPLW